MQLVLNLLAFSMNLLWDYHFSMLSIVILKALQGDKKDLLSKQMLKAYDDHCHI